MSSTKKLIWHATPSAPIQPSFSLQSPSWKTSFWRTESWKPILCTNRFFVVFVLWKMQARQEWKEGRGIMGTMAPKFQKEPDLSTLTTPRPPSLRLCRMTPSGHLEIPRDVRQKWLNDPVRSVLDKKMKSSLAVFPCFSPFHTGYVVFNICFSSSFFVGSLPTSTKTLIGVCGWRISIQFLLQLLVIQKLQHHSPSRKMLKGTCQMMQLAFQLQQLHLFVNHPPWPKLSSSLNFLAKSQLWWHWAWVLGKLSHAIWWTTRPSWVQAATLEYLEQPPRTHDPCSCMQEALGSQIRPRWGFPIWFFSSPNLIWSNCLSSWISNFSIFLSAGKGLFVETSQWEQSSWVQDSWSWWVGFPALNCSLRFFCWSFPSPSVSNLQTQQEIFSDKLS